MAYELRELQGNIFKNKHKKADNHPDMRGEFLINGVAHEIAIWHKSNHNGQFLGFKVSEKRERQEAAPQRTASREDPISTGRLPPRRNILPSDDEEIPF
jgi:hypothetical protein